MYISHKTQNENIDTCVTILNDLIINVNDNEIFSILANGHFIHRTTDSWHDIAIQVKIVSEKNFLVSHFQDI